jgi:hypothetical protein
VKTEIDVYFCDVIIDIFPVSRKDRVPLLSTGAGRKVLVAPEVQVSWERLGEGRRNTCRILLSQQYIGRKKAEPGRHIHPDPVLQYMNTSRNNVTSAGISIDRPSPF